MRSISIVLSLLFICSIIGFGCGGGNDAMHQSRNKNPQGLPNMAPQTDKDERGKASIKITEELTYPGMTSYAGMTYEFVSKDAPEVVAAWYESNLSGSNMKKTETEEKANAFWTVKWKDIVIRIYYINGNESIIKFKKDI